MEEYQQVEQEPINRTSDNVTPIRTPPSKTEQLGATTIEVVGNKQVAPVTAWLADYWHWVAIGGLSVAVVWLMRDK